MHWPTKLNVDVLAIICESLNDDSDVLSFFLTCSPYCNSKLLSMRPVNLTWIQEDFVLLEARSWLRYARPQSLQKLRLWYFVSEGRYTCTTWS